jgi:hypothetical protein
MTAHILRFAIATALIASIPLAFGCASTKMETSSGDADADSDSDADSDADADTDTDTGTDTDTDTATDTDTDTDSDTDSDTATDTDTDTGTDTDTDTDTGTGTDTGTDTGSDTGSDTDPPSAVYSQYFDASTCTAQCTAWMSFKTGLATSGYTSVHLYGDMDTVGFTCSDPAATQQIADMLRNYTDASVSCGGHVWSHCARDEGELWIDPPSVCDLANCPNPGWIVRPCFFGGCTYSGLNSNTCGAPIQTINIEFY